jgi:hypothetical protein
MNMTIELRKERVGIAGFPALLVDASLISRIDLSLAERHAIHEQMPLAVDPAVLLSRVHAVIRRLKLMAA